MAEIRPYDHHVFVCTVDNPTCGGMGSERVRRALQSKLRERGMKHRVRVSASGCLSVCAEGPVVVVYPEGIWYRAVDIYLTSTAQYSDARDATIRAARDLFGIGSTRCQRVAQSWSAVSVAPNDWSCNTPNRTGSRVA